MKPLIDNTKYPLRNDGCNKLQLLDCDLNLIDEVVAQNGL
jgi:hypothetical protein